MTVHGRLVRPWLLLALLAMPMLHTSAAHASPPREAFDDCAYQSEMWSLTQSFSKLFSNLWPMPTEQFMSQRDLLRTRLVGINSRYDIAHHQASRKASAALFDALSSSSNAVDGRDLGSNLLWTSKMRQAYDDVNAAYAALKTMCPLGHTASTLLNVSLNGTEYADNAAPVPSSWPWLSVTRTWLIRWSYNCYGTSSTFRIEARSISNKVGVAINESGVLYLGRVLAVPVDQRGTHGSGNTRVQALSGPVYLIVRSRCDSSIKVVG